ncbi:MobP3 family relaxase [Brevibacillus massiliensis]|uniref:MobP3 family relaxase n=1 Tax=Brevibacillus massiliensis TaxID=1118054 RepID=UPI00031A6CD5|nr:MobP3 family relaxase [Brevibacillus massiliensis]
MSTRYVSVGLNSPLVVKLGFYKPSKTNSQKNAAHIDYITRSGAIAKENEYSQEWEHRDELLGTAAGHAKYAAERPGSHGLFSENGPVSKDAIKNELKRHQGVVWRMIVSLNGEDAITLNMGNRKAWEEKVRASMADVAKSMSIPITNLRWAAAFHRNTDNPHVHIMLWEKKPNRTKGKLSRKEMMDTRRAFARELYGERRMQLSRLKTVERDLIRDLVKDDVSALVKLRKELAKEREQVKLELKLAGQERRGISPTVPKTMVNDLFDKLQTLANQMPKSGRVALKFMPEEVKQTVLGMADWVLKQPGLKIPLRKYLHAHEELTKIHVLQPAKVEEAKARAYEDLQKRVSQVLLKAAVELNHDLKNVEIRKHNQIEFTTSISQSVLSSIFHTLQIEQQKAEAQSEWQKQMDSRKKRKKEKAKERS